MPKERKKKYSNKPVSKRLAYFLWKKFFFSSLIFGLCFGTFLLAFPLKKNLFEAPFSQSVLDSDGTLLSTRIAADEQWRIPLLNCEGCEISPKYTKALIQFEDRRFYHHWGVDLLALARAFWGNLHSGKIQSGASTLSMQVIRLSQPNAPRTYLQKLKEIYFAILLEFRYSKKEILKLYAQYAPMGGNTVGLESACYRYFGRANGSLSWSEASLLAVLPNNPSYLHLQRNQKALIQKRNRLLKRLYQIGELNAQELQSALLEPLPSHQISFPDEASHYLNFLNRQKENNLHPSTLQRPIQHRIQQIVNQHLRFLEGMQIHNAGAVVIDNGTGKLIAYIGNTTLKDSTAFKYVDMVQAPRSTGSVLKPFLFAQMLDRGEITSTKLIPDVPTHYKGFTPQNYDKGFSGAVPANLALARSLNLPAVYLLDQLGVAPFYEQLKKWGMSTLFRPAEDYGLSLILGGAEGTLFEITRMYSDMADAVKNDTSSLVSSGAAWQTLSALLEAHRPGLEKHYQNFASSQKVAFKTGTSLGHRDAWAVGVTPQYTVGVLVANADGEGRPEIIGLEVAAPLLFEILNALPRSSFAWFDESQIQKHEVHLCALSGYPAGPHCPTVDSTWAPTSLRNHRPCPFHSLIALDSTESYQVSDRCYPPPSIKLKPWFTLPTRQEWFYKQRHASYRNLPPYSPQCLNEISKNQPMQLLYPHKGTQLYLPNQGDSLRNPSIFNAAHRRSDARIFWHLDDHYLGETQGTHKMSVRAEIGDHWITLVDDQGVKIERHFKVLSP